MLSDKRKYQNVIPGIPSTAVEVYRMLPEGTRCEVIFNELIMSPSPSPLHQLLLSDLHALLYNFLKETNKGKVLPTPIDVYLENKTSVVQPDIIVILKENLFKISNDGIYGLPDIVIEILSTNRIYDTQRKRKLYQLAGIKEYFMVDQKNKLTTFLSLDESGIYQQVYEEKGLFKSSVLACNLTF